MPVSDSVLVTRSRPYSAYTSTAVFRHGYVDARQVSNTGTVFEDQKVFSSQETNLNLMAHSLERAIPVQSYYFHTEVAEQ